MCGATVTAQAESSEPVFQDPTFSQNREAPLHRWVNWIAGFSGDFVASSISRYLPVIDSGTVVLDPFAGVGTTLLEGLRYGANVVGFEINPFAALVAETKLAASTIEPTQVRVLAEDLVRHITDAQRCGRSPKTRPPDAFKTRLPFFSKQVLAQVLLVIDYISGLEEPLKSVAKVALGSVMVSFSNYTYEPSLGSRPAAGKPLVENAPVAEIVAAKLREMAEDIAIWRQKLPAGGQLPGWQVFRRSFFDALEVMPPESVDLVVTSPPYMNNYHYVRNTRPQLFWLDLVASSVELRALEEGNYGKSWQAVRDEKTISLRVVIPALQEMVDRVRQVSPEKGPYGGPGWANYVASYINDTLRFVEVLREVLKPQGTAVIVIGNSVVQGIEIKVDKIFALLGEKAGFAVEGIYVIRNQRTGSSTVGTGYRAAVGKKPRLYDAAVVLRKT